jgi:hypothetical protein
MKAKRPSFRERGFLRPLSSTRTNQRGSAFSRWPPSKRSPDSDVCRFRGGPCHVWTTSSMRSRVGCASHAPHVWVVTPPMVGTKTVADIYGHAGDGLRQNINELPIDDTGRHLWLRRHLWRVQLCARTWPQAPASFAEPTSCKCHDVTYGADATHSRQRRRHSAVAGIYADASNGKGRNISGLPIGDQHHHLCRPERPIIINNKYRIGLPAFCIRTPAIGSFAKR